MDPPKFYRRLIPVSQYDIAGMETWLSDMAQKGFFLYDLGAFIARFTKDTPKNVRYRLEPAGRDKDFPEMALYDLYEERGWRYVTTYRKLFHVFMAEDAAAPELHTDPLVQSATLKKISRQLVIFSVAYLVLLAFLLSSHLFIEGDRVYTLLLKSNIFQFVMIPLFLIMTVYVLISAVRITKLRRRLQAGQPLEHFKKKRSIAMRIMEITGYTTLVVVLLSNLANLARPNNPDDQPLSEAPDVITILSLADIDPLYENYTSGYFYREHSPLVPIQDVVRQSIQIDAGYSRSVLQTYYYETAFTGLAKPLFDEMIRVHLRLFDDTAGAFKTGDYDPLDTPLFDAAVYAHGENLTKGAGYGSIVQYIIAYRDKTVIIVRYEGEEYLPDKLELIADTFL